MHNTPGGTRFKSENEKLSIIIFTIGVDYKGKSLKVNWIENFEEPVKVDLLWLALLMLIIYDTKIERIDNN